MSLSDRIEVAYYLPEKNWLSIRGRCLGYITPEEFNALMSDKTLQKKVFSSEGNTLKNLEKVLDIEDLRFVMAVSKVESNDPKHEKLPIEDMVSKGMGQKVLYISEPLDYVSCFPSDQKAGEFGVMTKSGTYLTIDLIDSTED